MGELTLNELIQHRVGDPALAEVLALILDNFAYMESRIDPPSSILRCTVDDLSKQCGQGEVWSIGTPPVACVCFTPLADALSLGRLAVSPEYRGQGLGKRLIDLAVQRAAALGFSFVELNVRVELIENISLYQHLGFLVTAEGTHSGFDRPTYLVMRKAID